MLGLFEGFKVVVIAALGVLLGGVVVGAYKHFQYEGLNTPWPVSMIWEGIDGRLDNAVEAATRQARARCEAEKEASRIAAERRDAEADRQAMAEMQSRIIMIQIEKDRATHELNQFKKAAAEDDAEEAAAAAPGDCPPRFIVGPRAARGLQRRSLPYPDSLAPAN